MSHAPRFPLLPLLSVLSVIQITNAHAATWYVDASAPGGAGTSWGDALRTISQALSVAADGDSIFVKDGEYNESLLLDNTASLLGGFSRNNGERNITSFGTKIEGGQVTINSGSFVEGILVRGSSLPGFAIYNTTREVVLTSCKIEDNQSPTDGGGVLLTAVMVSMTSCEITSNAAVGSGGGILVDRRSTLTLRDCVIRGNRSHAGGGIAVVRSNLIMSNCRLEDNRGIPYIDNESFAGGLYVVDSTLDCKNCLFSNNFANIGAQVFTGSPRGLPTSFMNCTFRFLSPFTLSYPQILWSDQTAPMIRSSIFQGETAILHWADENLLADITHSNIQGGYPGEGNISDDPLFRDPANGDFRLQHNSPCIDTGAMLGPPDDLDGKPRPIDIPGVGREGEDAFDMGAFEFQLDVPPPDPRTDINSDGFRDATDLLLLLQDWHRVSGPSAN